MSKYYKKHRFEGSKHHRSSGQRPALPKDALRSPMRPSTFNGRRPSASTSLPRHKPGNLFRTIERKSTWSPPASLTPKTYQPSFSVGISPTKNKPQSQPFDAHSHCAKRKARRKVLFQIQIAGHNRRRSPGQGGTYHRTAESERPC